MTGNYNVALAESWGQAVKEIALRHRPKLWNQVLDTSQIEGEFVAWAARWAFHWAARA